MKYITSTRAPLKSKALVCAISAIFCCLSATIAAAQTAVPTPTPTATTGFSQNKTSIISQTYPTPPATVAAASAESQRPAISSDGRFIVFQSKARNLVTFAPTFTSTPTNTPANPIAGPGTPTFTPTATPTATPTFVPLADRNHIFILDRQTNFIELVDKSPQGFEANNTSEEPSVSKDGRFVAFASFATNLSAAPGSTNGRRQIYVRDRYYGITNMISREPVIDGFDGVNNDSFNPYISGNGSFVIYESLGTNFNIANENCGSFLNGFRNVWVTNTDLRSCNFSVVPGDFSDGGTRVFAENNLNPSISDSGTVAAFDSAAPFVEPDPYGFRDIFVVSSSLGGQDVSGIARISNNRNRLLPANGDSVNPSVSADGKYIVFQSKATDMVVPTATPTGTRTPGPTATPTATGTPPTNVYFHDRTYNKTILCSRTNTGDPGNGDSINPSISNDGRFVAFESRATNLGLNNAGAASQIYVARVSFDLDSSVQRCDVVPVSVGPGQGGNGQSRNPAVSGDGNLVTYQTTATDLSASTDLNGTVEDILLGNRLPCEDVTGFADTDGDGTTDCLDQCPTDSSKVTDVDGDGDAAPNCGDGCPMDANKQGPLICGCGVQDIDGDLDGTVTCCKNCTTNAQPGEPPPTDGLPDRCDSDPNKTGPGICGCGVSDADSDRDGKPNCNDNCPDDARKFEPGVCGCGVVDTGDADADQTVDCKDACPNDPRKAADPGVCGCGIPDTDLDLDGVVCQDLCPTDAGKIAPGTCGCGVPDADGDGDGVLNCLDGCPTDRAKTAPGVCGCGLSDTLDTDRDNTIDCQDACPNDATKIAAGSCGCGIPETDINQNGVSDCLDPISELQGPAPTFTVKGGVGTVTVQPLGFAGQTVSYRYQFERFSAGTKSFPPAFTVSSNATTIKRRLRPGTYRVRYRAVINGTPTRYSDSSRSRKVR